MRYPNTEREQSGAVGRSGSKGSSLGKNISKDINYIVSKDASVCIFSTTIDGVWYCGQLARKHLNPMIPTNPSKAIMGSSAKPSFLQMALAFAIVRSKPDGVPLKEFLLRLRDYLRAGRQRHLDESQHRHLDSALFWRDQFERAKATQYELQTRIVHLERENDCLEHQIKVTSSSAPAGGSTKRKKCSGKDTIATKSVKRPKAAKEPTSNATENHIQDSFAEDFDTLSAVGEAGSLVAQSLYSVHKLYKQYNPDMDAFSFHLVKIASTLGTVVSTACKGLQRDSHTGILSNKHTTPMSASAQIKEKVELASVLRSSARAFTLLLLGLSKISFDEGPERYSGMVIYECVKMFRIVMDCITASALASAEQIMPETIDATSRSGASKVRGKASRSPNHQNMSRSISQFLIAILSYLDSNKQIHKEIFEGFMFVLLDRIGKRLFVCTFDRERSATIEGDISPPDNLGSSAAGPRRELELKALRLEIPSLIALLERAVTLAPHHFASLPKTGKTSVSGTKQSGSAKTSSGKSVLSIHAKERLQQTLVNCIFGMDEKDEFMDYLKMPARMCAMSKPPKVEEEDMAEWFKQEVWRLVGWEILGHEEHW